MIEILFRGQTIRLDCPMRHENGNCLVAGGFCTAVNAPICEALHNAYEAGKFHSMEEMKKQGYRKQSEWISVDERLPEQHKEVLVVCLGNIGTDFIATNGRWFEHNHWFVTHWMPLPEAPKMKGGEE